MLLFNLFSKTFGFNVYLSSFALLKPAATVRILGFVSRWRFGRRICVWLLFAIANTCLSLIIVFEKEFSAIIILSQQSSIATALLRSPLNYCDRSNRLWGKHLLR